MSDQLARDPIDIDPFQVVEFCALEVEDCRAGHHANVDSFAIEYIAVHDPRPRERGPHGKGCACWPSIARQIALSRYFPFAFSLRGRTRPFGATGSGRFREHPD